MATLKFRVLLDNVVDDEVFRDILISDKLSFEQFYHAIVDAFELSNDQMASFFVSDGAWNKGEEISLVAMDFDENDEATLQMSDLSVKDKIDFPRQRFILIHNFLSMWIFLIELQETQEKEIEDAQLLFAKGNVPQKMKEDGTQDVEEDYNIDLEDDEDDYYSSNGEDFFEQGGYENIDDLDI